MKKVFILTALMLVSVFVWAAEAVEVAGNTIPAVAAAQKEKTILVYDVYKHMETSSNVFLGIGGLSFAIGVALATTAHDNVIVLGAGIQSICWGAAETGLYLLDKQFSEKEKDPERARQKYAEMCGWNAVIDLALIAGGGFMTIFGNDAVKGHGIAIMMQGAMLATFNGINFFIASNPQDVKDWGAGVGYNFKIAGI